MTLEEINKKTVTELREMAEEFKLTEISKLKKDVIQRELLSF